MIWRILKWITALALLGVVLFSGVVYWYFYSNHAPKTDMFPLNIASLRDAANDQAGEKPSQIEVEIISHTPAPRIAMVGGTNWSEIDLIRAAYRIVSPEASIILDTGYSESVARETGATDYSSAAWTRTRQHIAAADMVLITHAHIDHSGGLDASAGNAWLSRLQIETLEAQGHSVPRGAQMIEFGTDGLFSPAPGIVIVQASGHTPGSQLVYVQLSDETEILFMGDTASMLDNVRLQRPRSRFVMERLTQADRGAVFAQTKALKALSEAAPDLMLVPGHDSAAIEALIEKGVLKARFTSSPAP